MSYFSSQKRVFLFAAWAIGLLIASAGACAIGFAALSANGYLDTACSSNQVITSDGVTYSLTNPAKQSSGCHLRRKAAGAWNWEVLPGVRSGATYNDLHAGIELKLSDDETLLFVVRNTRDKTEAPIWTDVFNVAKNPTLTVVQGLDCCMEELANNPTTTDEEGLRRRSIPVLTLARAVGAVE